MCRMLGLVGSGPVPDVWLTTFSRLALGGRIVPGWTPGHGDGWGLGAVGRGRAAIAGKGDGSPLASPARFRAAVDAACSARPESLILHLRKSSVGPRSVANSHPFLAGNALFCHNGTIRNPAVIPPSARRAAGGATDSERFFLFLADRVGRSGTPRAWEGALRVAVRFARARLRFTSLTFLLAAPGALFAYRECHSSESEREYPPGELEKYYTLYVAEAGGRTLVASEPPAGIASEWRPMTNRELRVFDAKGRCVTANIL